MSAWTDGRALGDARRAREAAAKEAEDQFNLKNDTSRDAEGNYVYNPGSEGEYKTRIWEKLGNETKAGSGRTGAPAPDARNLMTERRSRLKDHQDKMRGQLVQGGYSWAEDHMSPEKKEKYLQDQKIAAQEKEMNALKGQMGATATDNAILDFAKNGDASVFQQALRNDPNLRQAWREQGVELISNVDFKNDTHLLDAVGLTKEYLSNPEVLELSKKNIFKVYDGDKFSLRSVGDVFAEVGTGNRVTDQTAKEMIDNVTKYNMALNGVSMEQEQQKVDATTKDSSTRAAEHNQTVDQSVIDETLNNRQARLAEDTLTTNNENTDNELAFKNRELDITNENKDNELAFKERELEYKKSLKTFNKEVHDRRIKYGTDLTNESQELAEADAHREGLDETFKEKGFFNTDFSDPENQRLANKDMVGLAALADDKLAIPQKKQIDDIRKLITLADPAKELTHDETGWIDRWIHGAGQFLSDDITGAEAKTNWLLFRNAFRKALSGEQVTPSETESFNEGFGTLNKKLGPVLVHLIANFKQVRTGLGSIDSWGDRYLAHYRFGADIVELDRIIVAAEKNLAKVAEGIEIAGGKEPDAPWVKDVPVTSNPGSAASDASDLLDGIIKKNN